jgi:RNA polymerase sigma-70 factor (ECF subfamily)
MTSETPLDAETVQLIEKARSGHGEAFERLFDRHRPYLKKVVGLRLDAAIRKRVDPSDVVQDTYLEAHRRFGKYVQSPKLPFRLWLRQMACDQSMKAHRRHRKTARRSVDCEIALPEQSSLLLAKRLQGMMSTPSQTLQRKETARLIRDAIEKLPQHERDVVIMRHFEGLSNQEIGVLLNAEPATVSKRHGRAMLRLHEILFDPQG